MDAFEKIYENGIYIIVVNLSRSTIRDAYEFRKVLEEEINAGHTDLIIDLSKCDHLDSTFFGGLIWTLNKMLDVGKKLKIVKPCNPKEDIFQTTNTISLFDIYKTKEEALRSSE